MTRLPAVVLGRRYDLVLIVDLYSRGRPREGSVKGAGKRGLGQYDM